MAARSRRMTFAEAAARGRDAGTHAIVYGLSDSAVEKLVASLTLSGVILGMSVLARVWDRAARVLGPVAVRPMFELSVDLWATVGEGDLHGVPQADVD